MGEYKTERQTINAALEEFGGDYCDRGACRRAVKTLKIRRFYREVEPFVREKIDKIMEDNKEASEEIRFNAMFDALPMEIEDLPADIAFAYNHHGLFRDGFVPSPGNSPSRGAHNMLCYALSSTEKFFENVMRHKLTKKKPAAEADEKFKESDASIDELNKMITAASGGKSKKT